VEKFKYLGTLLYRTGNVQMELDNRVSGANLALNKLHNLILNEKKSTWETKNVLIKAMVNLVLLYGAEIWGADGTIKIRKAHLKIYKRLLLLPSNTNCATTNCMKDTLHLQTGSV
jgi:hypothetical protein